MSRLNLVVDPTVAAGDALAAYLRRCGDDVVLGGPLDGDAAVVVTDHAPSSGMESALAAYADAGGVVLLAGRTLAAWRDTAFAGRAGLLPGAETVPHEMRVRPGPAAGDVAARMGGDVLVTGPLLLVDKASDDVEVLLTANWQLTDHPVATVRGGVATVTLPLSDPAVHRLLHRVLRRAVGRADGPDVRVGLLGYGAIGHEHNAAIAATPGLTMAAVCDRNASRVDAALALAPDARVAADAEALVAADDVDLVVVSTPPDSHVDWTLRALAAGKHVVVEKPFCLTVAEADEMLAAAGDRVLAVYQNRRWDADYLALKRVVRSGVLGDVFHLESFVGGYGHPCNYWHSDEEISGGAVYDWGSHHLDWTLDLLSGDVEWVSATTQKRMWHDVTNADHSRVTLRFADGAEAEFVHSDLAAALKPKWYVLGTRGALRGDYVAAAVPTDHPAVLTVYTPDGVGGVHEQRLSVPAAPEQPFHRELADRLLSGEPMSVTPEGSRRNIAVMEAATASVRDGGRPVEVRA